MCCYACIALYAGESISPSLFWELLGPQPRGDRYFLNKGIAHTLEILPWGALNSRADYSTLVPQLAFAVIQPTTALPSSRASPARGNCPTTPFPQFSIAESGPSHVGIT